MLRLLLKSSAVVQCSSASLGGPTSLLNQQTDSTAIKATLILVNHMLILINFHTWWPELDRGWPQVSLVARVHTGCRFCGTGGWFWSYCLDSHTHPHYKPECNQPKHHCPAEEAEEGKQRHGLWSLPFRKTVLHMHEQETASPAGSCSCKDHKQIFLQSYLNII